MKNGNFLVIGAALAVLAVSCAPPLISPRGQTASEEGAPRSLTLKINNGVSRTLLPEIDMEVARYAAAGAGPKGGSFSAEFADQSLTVADLEPGDWVVTITAYNGDDLAVGAGSGSATVSAASASNLSVTVAPLPGAGTLILSLSWAAEAVADPRVAASLVSSGGVSRTLAFTRGGDGASFSADDVAAGYHFLTLQLLDGETVKAGAMESVRIVAGQTTMCNFMFEYPGGLVQGDVGVELEMQNPLAVSITGSAADMVAGAQMNLAAAVTGYEGAVVWQWYVNGVLAAESTANYVFQPPTAGYYRIDLAGVGAGGTRMGSATHAVWVTAAGETPIVYTIAYVLNGGTNPGGAATEYTIGSSVITLPVPTLTGSFFAGWYTNAAFTGDAVTQILVGSSGNKTFYARWTAATPAPEGKYRIRYVLNGTATLPENAVATYDNTGIPIPLPIPTQTGYTFAGWYIKADFTSEAVTEIPAGDYGDKVFFARWVESKGRK